MVCTKQLFMLFWFLLIQIGYVDILVLSSLPKGQLISKADWHAIDSPKKQTDEFALFAFLVFTANKLDSLVRFLGESMVRQSDL